MKFEELIFVWFLKSKNCNACLLWQIIRKLAYIMANLHWFWEHSWIRFKLNWFVYLSRHLKFAFWGFPWNRIKTGTHPNIHKLDTLEMPICTVSDFCWCLNRIRNKLNLRKSIEIRWRIEGTWMIQNKHLVEHIFNK